MSTEGMRDQIQLSFGRLVDWQTINPILLPGEVACVFDSDTLIPTEIRFGNGVMTFNQLPPIIPGGEVEEAPIDDKAYGRKNAAWAEIVPDGLDVVTHDASLSGNGTVASPLSVVNAVTGDYYTKAQVDTIVSTAREQLNAGIISLDGRLTTVEVSLAAAQRDIVSIQGLKATKDTSAFVNTALRSAAGAGYSLYSKCTVNGVPGFITGVDTLGGILSGGITLLQTHSDVTWATPAAVISSDGGSGALFTISSANVTNDLLAVQQYIESVLDLYSASKLSRGTADNLLKVVQNGTLLPIHISSTTKYVDNSYGGIEQGLEFAPFRTGQKALNALGVGSFDTPNTTSGAVYYAAGIYAEDLLLQYTTNKNILGLAVAQQSKTAVNSVTISEGASHIGLRDFKIVGNFSIVNSEGENYLDNISVAGVTSISSAGFNYLVHCDFTGDVNIVSGTVEFDACDFEGIRIRVMDGATAIVKDCTNVTVQVDSGASYAHLSGNATIFEGHTYAINVSIGAAYVGLFSGVAKDGAGAYSPINIPEGVPYALGTFLYDDLNSIIPSKLARVENDGLSTKQIVAGARTEAGEGYLTPSKYLDDHLNAISEAIANVQAGVSPDMVTGVDLVSGNPGELALIVTTGAGDTQTEPVSVPGLGSAAFTESTSYATAAQGVLADTAYQLPVAGIPKDKLTIAVQGSLTKADTAYQRPVDGIPSSHLDTAVVGLIGGAQQTINKVAAVDANSTDTQYPSAKAIYTQAVAPLAALNARLPAGSVSEYVDTAVATAAGRQISADAAGAVFESKAALQVGSWYYQGVQVVLQVNDRAVYIGTDPTTQWQTIYDGVNWVGDVQLGNSDTSAQLLAKNSGITAEKVAIYDNYSSQITTAAAAAATAQTAADTAQDTAEAAQSAAQTAQGAAETAQGAAETAQSDASAAQTSADAARIPAGVAGNVPTYSGLVGTYGTPRVVDDGTNTKGDAALAVVKGVKTVQTTLEAALSAGLATKITTPSAPASIAFLKLGSGGEITADTKLYQPQLTAYGTGKLLTAPESAGGQPGLKNISDLQPSIPGVSGASQLALLPSVTGGNLGSATLVKSASGGGAGISLDTADDSKVPSEKAVREAIDEKALTVSVAADGNLLLGNLNGAVVDSLLQPTAFLTTAEPPAAGYTRGAAVRRVAESASSITLASNTTYYSDNSFVAGTIAGVYRYLLASAPSTVLTNVKTASGAQSGDDSVAISGGLWRDSLFLSPSSDSWGAEVTFDRSDIAVYLGESKYLTNSLFKNSRLSIFTPTATVVTDDDDIVAKKISIVLQDSVALLELARTATEVKERTVTVTPSNAIIYAYSHTKVVIPGAQTGVRNMSATIYLHESATVDVSNMPASANISIYVCKDSVAAVPVTGVPTMLVNLKNTSLAMGAEILPLTQADLRTRIFGSAAIGSPSQPIYIDENGVPSIASEVVVPSIDDGSVE